MEVGGAGIAFWQVSTDADLRFIWHDASQSARVWAEQISNTGF